MAEQSGAVQGAKVGAAFGPWGAAAGAAIGMASDVVNGPEPGSFSGTGQFDLRSFMDGSGWTVSTGGSKATGGARTQTGDPFGAPMGATIMPTAAAGGAISPTMMAAGIGLLGLAVVLKKRG